jgi:hypothetical protein
MFAIMLIGLGLQAASINQAPSHRCWAEESHNGIKVRVYKGDRICVDLAPATEMEGVWVNDFEGSAFYEGARSIADVRGRESTVWFTIHQETVLPRAFTKHYGLAYRVKIVGRKARDMNREPLEGFGHMGMSRGLVVVDRIVRADLLGPARDR